MRRPRLFVAGALLLIALIYALADAERRTVLVNFFVSDPKVHGQPKSYWRATLQSNDKKTRTEAIFALGDLGARATDTIPDLIDLLKWEDVSENFLAATTVLGSLMPSLGSESSQYVPPLVNLLKSFAKTKPNDVFSRIWIVQLLGKIGPPAKEAVPELIHLVKEEELLRDHAIAALEKIDPTAAVNARGQ